MRARQRAQAKHPEAGASILSGGAQQQQQQHLQQERQQQNEMLAGGVVVKQEVPEVDCAVMPQQPSHSCQLLRKTIMDRRQAKGLGYIHTAVSAVKYELTAEEIEKKERRKEQNRRAARKCRMKKKTIQNTVQYDYAKMVEDNEKLEKESSNLRAQVASLKKILSDHVQSGRCLHGQPAITDPLPSLILTTSSVTSHVQSPPVVEQSSFDMYLKDFEGQISPDQTFTDIDLNTKVNLAPFTVSTESESLPVATIPDKQHLPLSCSDLKSLIPISPHACTNQSVLSPISPATNHSRQSTSSVTSEWSAFSEQSQGFGLVPVNGQSPVPSMHEMGGRMDTALDSTGEYDMDAFYQQDHHRPLMPTAFDINDEDDDVFRGDDTDGSFM